MATPEQVLQYFWSLVDKKEFIRNRTKSVEEYGRYILRQKLGTFMGDDMIIEIDMDRRNANHKDEISTPEQPDFAYLYETLEVDKEQFNKVAKKGNLIISHKGMYELVSNLMSNGIPWWFIGALHYRESHCNFNRILHNGELLVDVNEYGTRLVPKGRGKGKGWQWVDSAVDALTFVGLDKPRQWDITNCLIRAERFNGLGYRHVVNEKGAKEYSPYLFSHSNHHDETGKFVADGEYDPKAKEVQVGVATLWKYMGV